MKSFDSAHKSIASVLGVAVTAGLVAGLVANPAAAQPGTPASTQSSPPQFASEEDWRAFMTRTPAPEKGCYEATYPHPAWQRVPCTSAPQRPYPPVHGTRPITEVGNGNDYSAGAPSPHLISEAVGSFYKVTGVKSEKNECTNTDFPSCSSCGVTGNGFFSLQLNTNLFKTSVCSNESCRGWQQFVFANGGTNNTYVFIQYWLINYDQSCPSGWASYSPDCYRNSDLAAFPPTQSIVNLGKLTLTGQTSKGAKDTITFQGTSGGQTKLYTITGLDSILNASEGWTSAEFNIVGNGCGSTATFNHGSTVTVKTRIVDGVKSAPLCVDQGTTGETNNLTFVETTTAAPAGSSPEIVFTESNAGGSQNGKVCHPIAQK